MKDLLYGFFRILKCIVFCVCIYTETNTILFSQVLAMGAQKNPPEVIIKHTDTAALLYSSGTTGTNKGVVLNHRNFMEVALIVTSNQEMKGEKH